MLRDLVLRNRSTRRFDQTHAIDLTTLRELVDLARLSAAGGNLQALKFLLSCVPTRNAQIFPHLRWAGYLTDWPGPVEGERPTGHIVILWDTAIKPSQASYDPGIAAQSILLGATEGGLGGCIIGSIDRDGLRAALSLDARYEILLVLALGKPGEVIRLEELSPGGDHRYWRDAEGVHHVPKRGLDELIVG